MDDNSERTHRFQYNAVAVLLFFLEAPYQVTRLKDHIFQIFYEIIYYWL